METLRHMSPPYRCLSLIGGRNTGKTSRLLQFCNCFESLKVHLVVLDAATEHKDKSLIQKMLNSPHEFITAPSSLEIKTDAEIESMSHQVFINNSNEIEQWYPFTTILSSRPHFLYDVSYYLERGHDATSPLIAENLRELFRRQVAQILLKTFWQSMYYKVPVAVVMDEVEISSAASVALQVFSSIDNPCFFVLAAAHSITALGNAKDLFEIAICDQHYGNS
jgi:hypothetical protein